MNADLSGHGEFSHNATPFSCVEDNLGSCLFIYYKPA